MPDPVVFLTPAQGASFAGPLTDPWPDRLEGPDEQVDVGRWSDGTYTERSAGLPDSHETGGETDA